MPVYYKIQRRYTQQDLIVTVRFVLMTPVIPKQVNLCIFASLILVFVYTGLDHHTKPAYVIVDLSTLVHNQHTIQGLSLLGFGIRASYHN